MSRNDFSHVDRGDNCLVCGSTLEPHKYVCTVCKLAHRYGAFGGLVVD